MGYVGNVTSCYGGLVVQHGGVVVLGSVHMLQNDTLDGDGIAALDVNLISADRTLPAITWLRPGSDAAGSGPASIWDLFPDGVYPGRHLADRARRADRHLAGSAARRRRHRAAAGGGARGRGGRGARPALCPGRRERPGRRGATLGHPRPGGARLALPRTASADQVGAAAAPVAECTPAAAVGLLAGPAPADDAALLRLAGELDRFESDVRSRLDEGREHRG